MSRSLALPSAGGAATRTVTTPSSEVTTPSTREFGFTRTLIFTAGHRGKGARVRRPAYFSKRSLAGTTLDFARLILSGRVLMIASSSRIFCGLGAS